MKYFFLLGFSIFVLQVQAQDTVWVEGDTIIRKVTIWENYERDHNAEMVFNPFCINGDGDTMGLEEFIYDNFDYPQMCIEHGMTGRGFYKIDLDAEGKVIAFQELRPHICKTSDFTHKLDNGLKSLRGILCYARELTLELHVDIKLGKQAIDPDFPGTIINIPVLVEKPVIYFYPQKKTEVNVKLDFKGELGFCYPAYKDGWSFTAQPDGNLIFDEKSLNYIFWEGKTTEFISYKSLLDLPGFVVTTDSLVSFLEEKLAYIGLTSNEIQDFVTYWVPAMKNNEWNRIHFLVDKEYGQYADLTVTPKPDEMIRIFMLWSEAMENEKAISEQVLPSHNRKGFVVVEWGGTEILNQTLSYRK